MDFIKESESIIIYDVEVTGLTVEEVLSEKLSISGRLLRRLMKSRGILLNGKVAREKQITGSGDTLKIVMEEEENGYTPEDTDIEIIYEDFDLILINKQPNIVVHPTKSHVRGTIANAIAKYFMDKGIKKKIRFVNRLDMDTSGILVVAKNPFGHQHMAKQFEDKEIEKRYLAVVEGVIKEDEGRINLSIGRDQNQPEKNIVTEDGKKSITHYRVVERYKDTTLVELDIKTGRTHQIRVHLSYIGHPIIGDTFYNRESNLINRQALHSYFLSFNKPRGGERVTIKAELPRDIKELIRKLKN